MEALERNPLIARTARCVAALGLLVGLTGCAAGYTGRPPEAIKPRVFTPERLAKLSKPPKGRSYRLRPVGRTKAAWANVARVSGETAEFVASRSDQALFIISGRAVVSLNGERTLVGPGAVVLVPRGCKTRIIRGKAQGKAPLVFVQVSAPPIKGKDPLEVALKGPKKKAKKKPATEKSPKAKKPTTEKSPKAK